MRLSDRLQEDAPYADAQRHLRRVSHTGVYRYVAYGCPYAARMDGRQIRLQGADADLYAQA